MTSDATFIRAAEGRDDEAVGELLVRAFIATYERKMPEVVVSERRQAELRDVAGKRRAAKVWVAERDGRVVGTVALWGPGAQGSEAWLPNAADLRHLGVDEGEKGRGTSSRLMDTAEVAARQLGCDAVCLHVRRGVEGLRRLYEARGYVRDAAGDLDLLPEVFLEAFALRLRG